MGVVGKGYNELAPALVGIKGGDGPTGWYWGSCMFIRSRNKNVLFAIWSKKLDTILLWSIPFATLSNSSLLPCSFWSLCCSFLCSFSFLANSLCCCCSCLSFSLSSLSCLRCPAWTNLLPSSPSHDPPSFYLVLASPFSFGQPQPRVLCTHSMWVTMNFSLNKENMMIISLLFLSLSPLATLGIVKVPVWYLVNYDDQLPPVFHLHCLFQLLLHFLHFILILLQYLHNNG